MAKKYIWTAPKYFEGDAVVFRDHRGSHRSGVVSFVETRYKYDTALAYHVYYIQCVRPKIAPGEVRYFHRWIPEENVF